MKQNRSTSGDRKEAGVTQPIGKVYHQLSEIADKALRKLKSEGRPPTPQLIELLEWLEKADSTTAIAPPSKPTAPIVPKEKDTL